jgi:hypothetical protein
MLMGITTITAPHTRLLRKLAREGVMVALVEAGILVKGRRFLRSMRLLLRAL